MKTVILFLVLLCSSAHAGTVYFIPVYGQSTGAGNWGCGAISTSQPYGNIRLNVGLSTFIPLIEDSDCVGGAAWSSGSSYVPGYVVTSAGSTYVSVAPSTGVTPGTDITKWVAVTTQESPGSAMANNVTLIDATHAITIIVNNYSVAGQPISALQKGSGAYNNLIAGVTAAHSLAVSAGNTLIVPFFYFVEGETDFVNGSMTFKPDNLQLRGDLDSDIRPITGQTVPVAMVFPQLSSIESAPSGPNLYTCMWDGATSCADDPTGVANPLPTEAQWELQRDYSGLFFLTGPRYQYLYGDGGFHQTNQSYNEMGATASRIIANLEGVGTSNRIAGVFPASISRSGTTVTIQTYTPNNLALAIDTTTVPAPYRNGAYHTTDCGFQFIESTGATEIPITNCTVSGTTITLTLNSTPSTTGRILSAFEGQRFAWTPQPNCSPDTTTCDGQTVFPSRGTIHTNIRTVADFTDVNGDPIYHWMVTFNEPVGFSWNPFPSPGTSVMSGGIATGGIRR